MNRFLSLATLSFSVCLLLFSCTQKKINPNFQSSYSTNCQTEPKSTIKYCISEAKEKPSQQVLYYFHGAGGTEKWFKANSAMYHTQPFLDSNFTIVSISLGRVWFLRNEKIATFLDQIETLIESKLKAKPKERFLVGDSMGGFNAVQLFLFEPDFFKKAVFACPAFNSFLPINSESYKNYSKRSGASSSGAKRVGKLASRVFKNEADMKAHSPISKLEKIAKKIKSKVYVTCGDRDELGFYPTAKEFSEKLDEKGVDVVWNSIANRGHCAYDPRAIAKFIND